MIPGTRLTLSLSIKSYPSSRYLFFSDVILVSKYRGSKGQTIKLIPFYMIDIIYKTVKPSYLKKLQIIENINNTMVEFIFIFSDLILIKQIIVSTTAVCCWLKQIFKKILPGGMSNFSLPIV